MMSWALCFSAVLVLVSSVGLRDHPIAGDYLAYLDGNWTLSNGNKRIVGAVPGDLITDLQVAGLVGDPLYENNWLTDSAVWSKQTWTYTTSFLVPDEEQYSEILLVFEGIKMDATITLNGQSLGQALDQFLRYQFPVSHLLNKRQNVLTVEFAAGTKYDCQGRFMACTGGWDWSPYSNTYDQHGAHTLSKGIWKSVYIVATKSVFITQLVPQVFYTGDYPTTPLVRDTDKFQVYVHVHFFAPQTLVGKLSSKAPHFKHDYENTITLPKGESTFTFVLAPHQIKLWWPNGLGSQALYTVPVTFTTGSSAPTTVRKIGFRTVALVTANDTKPDDLKGKDGSGTFTMRLKVNGADIWTKGGNMIPMENYEGRANEEAFRRLVVSAAEGRFNLLRIWGGGIFYYDVFYEACDELGIMMYHDMMYAQQNHAPSNSKMQEQELRYQVRRLSHHPSIVIWDGCNECGGQGIYNSFVVTTVASEDTSRPVWPSCPAYGYTSGVDMLWGLPNGKALVPRNGNSGIETHGPYQHGNGFKTVNDPDGNLVLFNANLPPATKQTNTGVEKPGIFASEFGCVGMSSFESMSVTLTKEHWSLHASPMYQRNYPCDNIIQVYFGKQDLSKTGEAAFKRQLYQCLIGQALELKSDIEVRRSTNEMGTVIWQLNEIWPTGGWGTVEYGTPVAGQVLGGRWKPAHYLLRASIFADVMATCGAGTLAQCYIKNDSPFPFSGSLEIAMTRFSDSRRTIIKTQQVSLAAGSSVTQQICAVDASDLACAPWSRVYSMAGCTNGTECIMTLTVKEKNEIVSQNVLALVPPYAMKLPEATITWQLDNNGKITLTSNKLAAYVVLTTAANGRFSENAFLMDTPTKEVTFIPWTKFDVGLLRATLRVEHLQQNL